MNDSPFSLETYRSLVSLGCESLKALQLLNGGAIVALLAYLGQSSLAHQIKQIFLPMSLFVVGLSIGTFCFLGAYFTQLALLNEGYSVKSVWGVGHSVWLWMTVIMAILA